MKPRRHADLAALVRTACTHASHLDREVPLVAFDVQGHTLGWLRPSFANALERWPHWFTFLPEGVRFAATPDTVESRSAALAQVTRALAAEGIIHGWRDETVSVSHHYAAPEMLRIERAATRAFGMMAYGAHLTGFTRRQGELHLWIARRSSAKSVDPGLLDNLVGGRIASGFTVEETIRKEAWEEAGLAPAMLAGVPCVGALRVEYGVPEGLHREILFVHDLWLPPDFTPRNTDGEVAALYCLGVPETIEALLAGEFTPDAGTVTVDALLRQGIVAPEDPDYLDLVRLPKP
jgi:8-oxo-dGTP pyrophosphatase MutT (NUDIX family)